MQTFPTDSQLLDVMSAVTRLETMDYRYRHCCDRCAGLLRKSATAHGREAFSIPADSGLQCYFCYEPATVFYCVAIAGKMPQGWQIGPDQVTIDRMNRFYR